MREILFKAKRIDNGEWLEGYIAKRPTGEWNIERKCDNPPDGDPMWKKVLITYQVDPSTICQYTGLKDKNGVKIWENDIVAFPDCEMSTESGYGDCFTNVGSIAYDTGTMSYFITNRITVDMNDIDIKEEVEVIGNTFDNLELLV